MNQGLVNKEILFQNRTIDQKNNNIASKPKKNRRDNTKNAVKHKNRTTISDRFRCWRCGLYQGDVEICSRCNYGNS